jgi:hypothetical protein
MQLLIVQFFPSSFYFLSGPKILLRILFSDTLNASETWDSNGGKNVACGLPGYYFSLKDGGDTLLRNVSNRLQDYTASQPGWPVETLNYISPLWEKTNLHTHTKKWYNYSFIYFYVYIFR